MHHHAYELQPSPPRFDISSVQCESYNSSEDPTDGGFVRLFGRAKKEKWGEKARVTYFVETDQQLRDLTVIGTSMTRRGQPSRRRGITSCRS